MRTSTTLFALFTLSLTFSFRLLASESQQNLSLLMEQLEEDDDNGAQEEGWSCGPSTASSYLRICLTQKSFRGALPTYHDLKKNCPKFDTIDLLNEYFDEICEKFPMTAIIMNVARKSPEGLEYHFENMGFRYLGPSASMLTEYLNQIILKKYHSTGIKFKMISEKSNSLTELKKVLHKKQAAIILTRTGIWDLPKLKIGEIPRLHFLLVLDYSEVRRTFTVRETTGEIEEIQESELLRQWHWNFEKSGIAADILKKHQIKSGQMIVME